MAEVTGLDRIVGDLQVAIVAVVRSAAVRAGTLVAGFEVCYDEAYDRIDEYAQMFGPEATDAVLSGLDDGMSGAEITEDATGGLARPPASPQPPAPPEVAEGPFSDWDEVSAAVLGWAGRWLVAAPGARVSSADLAAHWAAHVGRPLTGYYRHVSDAVAVWAEASGAEVTRYRTRTARGLVGLALVTPSEPPAVNVTPSDHQTVTPAGDEAVAVTLQTPEPMQQRAPAGGRWQTVEDLAGADAVSDDWFEV